MSERLGIGMLSGTSRDGVDAVLVQDFGVARLVRQICPDLQLHASTQMRRLN